jgi:putative DNA primase/helicase
VSDGALQAKNFFEQLFANNHVADLEAQEYGMRRLGASLRAGSILESIELWWGPDGSTGRSTAVQLIHQALGDYSCTVPTSLLMTSYAKTSAESATPFRNYTKNKRFAFVHEVKLTDTLDEQLCKQYTGGDSLPNRALYTGGGEFTFTASLILLVNSLPGITKLDSALRDRLAVQPFLTRWNRPHRPTDQLDKGTVLLNGDPLLRTKLPPNPDAQRWILWALVAAGVRFFSNRSLGPVPPRVKAATDEYVNSQDVYAIFVKQHYKITGSKFDKIRVGDMYKSFVDWRVSEGIKAEAIESSSNFGKRFKARFSSLTIKEVGGKTYTYGIRLLTAVERDALLKAEEAAIEVELDAVAELKADSAGAIGLDA